MTIRLHGFGIAGFRSFKDEQFLGPFDKINIFIGENNCGKSNLLRFIRNVCYPITSKGSTPKLASGDHGLGTSSLVRRVPVLFPVSKKVLVGVAQGFADPLRYHHAESVLTSAFGNPPSGYAWLPILVEGMRVDVGSLALDKIERSFAASAWGVVHPHGGGKFETNWVPGLYERVIRALPVNYDIQYIPTLRRLPSRLAEYKDEYGEGGDRSVIENIARWQNPPHTRGEDRRKFEKIETFLRQVLRRDDIELTVDYQQETINVQDGPERYLPIEALGTGIHQLVVLAATALQHDDALVCIEEPELHFHPELQHQFMRFIADQTTNQYFITTHSAHIMDAVDCAVFSVRHDHGASTVERPLRDHDRHRICHDLGYRPSTLLQANSLIWVEGPSDRLYLLHWLEAVAPELEEGWHFSVMHYGGRLLSNLSVSDEVTEDFMRLLPINRFPGILIDSDRRDADAEINATKTRIVDEVSNCEGFSWVTDGREIENYIPDAVLEQAVQKVHSSEARLARRKDRFADGLAVKVGGKPCKPDKLAIAKEVCKSPANLSVLDLDAKVRELANFIYHANKIDKTV